MRLHSDSNSKIVTVNGEFLSSVSVHNRGFLYGDGLFESMLFCFGKIPFLALHLERLKTSCLRLSIPYNEQLILSELQRIQNAISEKQWAQAKIRITVCRGQGGHGSYGDLKAPCDISVVAEEIVAEEITAEALKESVAGKEVSLKPAKHPLPACEALAGIKHLNRLAYIVGANGVHLNANEEVFFCDSDNNIVETMHHNIFFLSTVSKKDNTKNKETIITPTIKTCGVSGVLRSLVQQYLCSKLDVNFQELSIPVESIANYQACFIGNSVRGFTSVKAVGDVIFTPSAIVEKLNKALRQKLQS